MANAQFLRAGQKLAEAWKVAGVIDGLLPTETPQSRADAYAIADAMADAVGEPVTGWKVGATSAKMRELDGHDDVIPGRMFSSTTWEGNDATLPAARFPHARAETEFAFRLKADVSLRDAVWTVAELAPIVVLHPAVEIIGNRYPKVDGASAVGTLDTIADNGGGIGFVFGEAVEDWQVIDFQQHEIRLTVDGRSPAKNFLGELRCVPIEALADLVNHLQSRQIPLTAGQYVSTGAATVPQPVTKGSRVVADFGALGCMQIHFV